MIWVWIGAIYLGCVNLLAYWLMKMDKRAAVKRQWRVKEQTLMLVAALGGSVGMLLAMQLLRHKTRHYKFRLGVPSILVLQIAVVIVVVWLVNK
jgi:uncharacterized membrane protein YsdA (DUF1294 family)